MKSRPSFRIVSVSIVALTVGFLANTVKAQNAPALPYGASEVVKLYRGGINKDVIVNYINGNALPYHLNADGIIYLQKTLGMPEEITKAMIVRDGQLQQQQQQQPFQQPLPQYYSQQPPMQPGNVPPYDASMAGQPPMQQVVAPTTVAPPVTVIGDDYPAAYGYGYPYYGYGYGYGWPYYGVGFGWGGGWGYGGGFRGGYGGFGGRGGFGGGGFRGGGGGHGGGGHR